MANWWDEADWGKIGGRDGEDEVVRREFLKLVLALGGMGWGERSSVAAQVAAQCAPDRGLVDELDLVARQLGARWDDGHPAMLHRQLLGLHAVVGHLVADSPPMWRRDLQQLAGRTAAMAGLLERFLGRDLQAANHFIAADVWALEAGDDHLRALAAVWHSDIDSAVQAGRPGPSSRFVLGELARAESCSVAAAPAVRALVLLRRAEELAALGDGAAAYRHLDLADTAWAPGGNEGLYGIGWTADVNRAFRANVAVLAGRPADALSVLGAVIGTATGSNRVAALTDLASALARLGEIEQSAELLLEAWSGARAAGLEDRARRVRGIRHRDLAGYESVAAVRRLDEALA